MTTSARDNSQFVRSLLDSLAGCKESIPADYINPVSNRPAKPFPLTIPVVEPTAIKVEDSAERQEIVITVKNLKAGAGLDRGSISLTVRGHDSIQQVKEAISRSSSGTVEPANIRLVLKGKALLDTKLVKEYDNLTSGSLVHLALKAPVSATSDTTISADNLKASDPMDTDSPIMHAPIPHNVAKNPAPLYIPNQSSGEVTPLQASPLLSGSPNIARKQFHARTPSITITPTATDPSQMHPHLTTTGRAGSPTSATPSVDVSENAAFPAMPFVAGKRATILASSSFWTGLRDYIEEELRKDYEKKLVAKAQAAAATPGNQSGAESAGSPSTPAGFGTPSSGTGHHRRNSSTASGTASPSSERTQIQIDRVWETMFLACKPLLTPNEIAKIRDDINQVGDPTPGRQ